MKIKITTVVQFQVEVIREIEITGNVPYVELVSRSQEISKDAVGVALKYMRADPAYFWPHETFRFGVMETMGTTNVLINTSEPRK